MIDSRLRRLGIHDCRLLLRVYGYGVHLSDVDGAAASVSLWTAADQAVRVRRRSADIVGRTAPELVRMEM